MIVHYFIVLLIVTFISLSLYTFWTIYFKKDTEVLKKVYLVLKNHSVLTLAFLIIIFVFIFLIYLFANNIYYQQFYKEVVGTSNSTGAIGDLFNGLITPTISIISVIYLWKAFMQQFKANQLLYGFEIERSFKNDIEWLRNNSHEIEKLEKTISQKNEKELKDYLESFEIFEIRKSIFIIMTFNGVYRKLNEKKSIEHKLNDIENEILMTLESLYLPAFKNIFRRFITYINNDFDNDNEIDINKIEVQFILKFYEFYKMASNIPHDKSFEVQFKRLENLLN